MNEATNESPNPALRHQVAHLDRTLLALCNERARLVASLPPEAANRGARADDLLRRNPGPLAAEDLRAIFAAIDRGCGLEPGP